MNRRQFNLTAIQGLLLSAIPASAAADNRAAEVHYDVGSVISPEVLVEDSMGQVHSLRKLLDQQDKKLNVVFLFGGGAMGSGQGLGGIWCPDSFEDLHILRTLVDNYQDSVAFMAIACPPVFHSKKMGFADRAFLDYAAQSDQYQQALEAFVSSTQRAVAAGIIPLEPYFDPRFRLLMSATAQQSVSAAYGDVPLWQGSFRAENETQHYGVPNFWLLGMRGEVLTKPFRGNVYHPHGGAVSIRYSLVDIIAAIERALA